MGKFVKGQSGNPGGRPKTIAALRELAQGETEANVRALVAIRDNKKAPYAARVAAVRELLDRGYGRPAQAVKVSGDRENPLEMPHRVIIIPAKGSIAAPIDVTPRETAEPRVKPFELVRGDGRYRW